MESTPGKCWSLYLQNIPQRGPKTDTETASCIMEKCDALNLKCRDILPTYLVGTGDNYSLKIHKSSDLKLYDGV